MKKKALVILLAAIIISVFFCIPVNAQILYSGVARDIDQQGNIIMTTSVNQFDENSTSYHQAYLLVTVQLENISSSPTYVGYARFSFSFPDVDCSWDDFESFSNDAVLTRSVDGQYSSFKVIPNNEFSYNDGIVVPPNSSIYAIGIIGLRNSYDNAPVIQGFTVTNSIGTVATSDNYPYGQTVDYSPLITSLNTYFGTEHTDLTNILTILGYLKVDTGNIATDVDDIDAVVNDIAALITYSGSTPSNYPYSSTFNNDSYPLSDNKYRRIVRAYRGNGYSNTDIELDASNDNLVQTGSIVIPVVITIQHNNNANQNVETYYINWIDNVLPTNLTGATYFNIDYFNSDIYQNIIFSGSSIGFVYKYKTSSTLSAIQPGSSITTLIGKIVVPVNTNLVFSSIDIDRFNYNQTYRYIDGYYPKDIFTLMRDWFTLWRGNSNTNEDISDDSGTLKTESDAIHQQEQAYYTQNQQAIEATGLRNYNFSQSQGDGIARVSLDFTNLWNSLGSFNSVYIFSLTLGLALTILRHAPNAISRIRWKKNQ